MSRDKPPPPESSGDIPEWFMTYSDVITLLMTFFILLLTFASNEPEQFERMQTSMFSGSGGSGMAGEEANGIERESFVIRTRPRAARVAMRGSEMPPIETDPSAHDLSSALAGLEDDEIRKVTARTLVEFPLAVMLDNGTVSAVGREHLRMLSRQLIRSGYHANFGIHATDDAAAVLTVLQHLIRLGVAPGKLGVGSVPTMKPSTGRVRLEIVREDRGP